MDAKQTMTENTELEVYNLRNGCLSTVSLYFGQLNGLRPLAALGLQFKKLAK